ncbi:hypothetical protein [Sphingomonas sp. KR3-1]|uniref:hypothetical protein n=1 Tax=Sphingomonas sp. KR3-1 TaxID=3156611 RepID=UPI0032B48CB9
MSALMILALIAVGLLLLLPLSWLACAAKEALEPRLKEWRANAIGWLRPFSPIWAWRTGYALPERYRGEDPVVYVIVDQRLAQVTQSMRRVAKSMREATSRIAGLGGTAGPGALSREVTGMQRRLEELAEMGGEIDEDLFKSYQGRANAIFVFWASVLFGIAACAVNGNLLNLFFQDVFHNRVAGIPASVLVATGFILGEISLGFGAAYFKHGSQTALQYLCCFAVVLAALFEAIIFGLVSSGFDLDIEYFDTYPILKFWMAPLGLIFVTATFIIGYLLHQSHDAITANKAALRLRREIRALNKLTGELPRHWDQIRAKAHGAESAISQYVASLGNKSGALTGSVDAVTRERDAVLEALANARTDDWRQWLDGAAGDARLYRAASVGIAALSIAVIGAFAWGLSIQVGGVYSGLQGYPAWAIGLLGAIGCYLLGLPVLARIQMVDHRQTRVFSHRSEPWQQAAAGALGAMIVTALIWLGLRWGGTNALPFSLLMVASAGVLAVLGYSIERALMGLVDAAATALAIALAAFFLSGAVLTYALMALAWLLIALFLGLLEVLALPWKQIRKWLRPEHAALSSIGAA